MGDHLRNLDIEVSDDSEELIQSDPESDCNDSEESIESDPDGDENDNTTNLGLLKQLNMTPDELYSYITSNNIKVTGLGSLMENLDYYIREYISTEFTILMRSDRVKAREFATIHSRELIDEYYGDMYEQVINYDVLEILLPLMTDEDVRKLRSYGCGITKNGDEELTVSDVVYLFDRFPRIYKVLSRNS